MASDRPENGIPYFARLQSKVQCVAAGTLGLALLTLPPELILRNPIANAISIHVLRRPGPVLQPWGGWGIQGPVSPEVMQLCVLCGVFSCAISLAYGISMYHGFDEWIYISVPGRLAVAFLGLSAWALDSHSMSPLLVIIIVWDGTVALITGWTLGTWKGRPPKSVVSAPAK